MERRIFGLENEYGVTCTLRGQRRLSPDEVARYLFRRVGERGSGRLRRDSASVGRGVAGDAVLVLPARKIRRWVRVECTGKDLDSGPRRPNRTVTGPVDSARGSDEPAGLSSGVVSCGRLGLPACSTRNSTSSCGVRWAVPTA